jgi:hypothetical protein
MILPWIDLIEECPLAMQLIEAKTEFKYSPIYGVPLNEDQTPIRHEHLERFFDDQGWFMTAYPAEFPGWNGVITDTQGQYVFSDPAHFSDVKSRNHAKSLLAGIAIKCFQKRLMEIIEIPENAYYLDAEESLIDSAQDKDLKDIVASDLTFDAEGLVKMNDFVVLKKDKKILVIKSNLKLPLPGMVISVKP